MKKKFFTKVSPKAVNGIRKVYEARGDVVHAKRDNQGHYTVVVIMDEAQDHSRSRIAVHA